MEWRVVGIDVGLRDSLGCVLLRVRKGEGFRLRGRNELRRRKEVVKKLYELGEGVREFICCEGGYVFSLNGREERFKVGEVISSFFDEGDGIVVIEDFMYWGRSDLRRKASWFIVARMQNLIGYLSGFLEGRGIEVKVVAPRTWKAVVEPWYVDIGKWVLGELKLGRSQKRIEHVYSAFGIGLSEVVKRLC